MEVNISTGEKWKRHIEVALPASEFQPHVEKHLRTVQKRAQVDGFRPGKVPMQVVEKIYGKAIRQQTIEELLPELLTQVRDQHHLHTVGPANIDEVIFENDNGLKLRATVEVEPEFELGQYSDFEIVRTVYDVTEADIDERLQMIRQSHGWLESVENGAQAGHLVTADIQILDPMGVPLIGKKAEGQRFLVSAETTSPNDFTPQLLGVKSGESRNVRFTAETEDGRREENHFRVDVKDVHEQKLPELDDEFARDLGKFETLEELRKAVSDEIRYEAQRQSNEAYRHQIIEEVLKHNPFDLPEALLEAYTNAHIEDLQRQYKNLPAEAVRDDARVRMIRHLRWRFLRIRIVEVESLFVSDDEVRAYVQSVAESGKEEPQKFVNKIMGDVKELEYIRDLLQEGRVMSMLEGRMKTVERHVAFKERNQSPLISA